MGFYYLRARYLNPDSGRFWTLDSYEGNPSDPLSIHKYLYAQSNPVMKIDPSGRDFVGVTISASIGSSLDAMYNGAVLAVFQSMHATISGVKQGLTSKQIVTGYYTDVAIGFGIGFAIGKLLSIADSAIYGAETRVVGSISEEARVAAQEAALEGRAGQYGSKGYGYVDRLEPGLLSEGDYIFSTTMPGKGDGLWATDVGGAISAAGKRSAYEKGTQLTPSNPVSALARKKWTRIC